MRLTTHAREVIRNTTRCAPVYLMVLASLPKNLKIERTAPEELPGNWRSLAGWGYLQALGRDYANPRSSAVTPAETNYLLNPLHPQFGRIEVGEAETYDTDRRFLSS